MKTKHTQGDGWVSSGYRVDVDIADGLSGICEMSDWMGEEQMEANAQLIAEAPELLKHLQYMIDAWEDVRISGRNDIMEIFIEPAKEAVKKATR